MVYHEDYKIIGGPEGLGRSVKAVNTFGDGYSEKSQNTS